MNIIEVKHISKEFKDKNAHVLALSDISFSLKEGDDLAIIGPSGSGKTTLLQILGGISNPTKGEVLINEKKVNKGNDNKISEFRNLTVGFVFQNIYLQDYLTAKENVMIPMLIKGISKKQAGIKAEKLLDMVELSNRANHRPSKLSGGEEQRVAIARALANDPKILFADEPTAKLDERNRKRIFEIFKTISDAGISIVVITHDTSYAKVFKNVIYLEEGKLKKKTF
ncbi:ABC transporter ATP-binding protein [Candidatus Dojkabacteria bacterium]|jgi:putative ABC transport system ATP-binding protein|nr:ABC transporter ATP-binding protein [Candidatus Dojkabacteria bacterium]